MTVQKEWLPRLLWLAHCVQKCFSWWTTQVNPKTNVSLGIVGIHRETLSSEGMTLLNLPDKGASSQGAAKETLQFLNFTFRCNISESVLVTDQWNNFFYFLAVNWCDTRLYQCYLHVFHGHALQSVTCKDTGKFLANKSSYSTYDWKIPLGISSEEVCLVCAPR